MTALSQAKVQQKDAVGLMVEALQLALKDASLQLHDLDTLIALPSLMSDQHFMIGHAVAQQVRDPLLQLQLQQSDGLIHQDAYFSTRELRQWYRVFNR